MGNPRGYPVAVVHGGPGAGSDPGKAAIFDLTRWRVFLIDGRGCGGSAPIAAFEQSAAALADNTTPHLVDDLHRIKRHLRVGSPWLVAGGSFGSTLALAYAMVYPADVAGLLLWAV